MNYQGILDNIIELAGHKLNDWEENFIDDIYNKYYNCTENLTDLQKHHIRKIQNKYLKY